MRPSATATAKGALVLSVSLAGVQSGLLATSAAADGPATTCATGRLVSAVAIGHGLPIGFEAAANCWLSGSSFPLGAVRPERELFAADLDAALSGTDEYSWRTVRGMAVVRPLSAWTNRTSVLDRPASPFDVANRTLDEALHAALASAIPSALFPHEDVEASSVERRGSVTFEGGTLLDALNAIALAYGVNWQIGYGSGRASVALSPLLPGGPSTVAPLQ